MPGDMNRYEQEMYAGNESAWNQDWVTAANHYGRALQEFPQDSEAHLNLGFALLRQDRLDEALKIYSRAIQLTPNDPIPLEKSAEVLEQMGRLKEAAQQYAGVADVYLKQRDIDKAISNWERATELTPGLVAIHAKLAKAYKQVVGDRKRAVYQYLMLAFNLSHSGDMDQAKKAVQQALALNKKHTEALNAYRSIESGRPIKQPSKVEVDDAPENPDPVVSWSDLEDFTIDELDPLGPMGDAMTQSLSTLATHIMMSGGFESGGVEALQAMEFQRQGLHSEAISAYKKASNQMKFAPLSLNLGALLLLSDQPADAVSPLNEASTDEELKVGAYHALGQAYYNQQKYKRAVSYLAQAAQLFELPRAKNDTDQQEIKLIYNSIIETASQRAENDENLGLVAKRLIGLMRGKSWDTRLADARNQMMEAHRDGGGSRVLEFLAEDVSEGVTESVAKIDRYIRQGLYTLAMDEAQYAIEKAPTYLPIHVRMAEVMMAEGRLRQAITKYNTVAKTYRVRGENGRAASILFEVLEMAPLDVDVRQNLIELLESEERWEEVLDQYIALATTYRQLGNLDMARNIFTGSEDMAKQVDANKAVIIRIKHELADIDQLRVDIRQAQRNYEEIIKLDPEDEKARKALVDTNMQMGNEVEAIKQLDELLRIYAKRKQVKSILKVLQELVRSYPSDSGLRSRLAAIYRQLGHVKEAIEQLNELMNLQLDSGLTQDACGTIDQIIKLNPSNIQEYQATRNRLGC